MIHSSQILEYSSFPVFGGPNHASKHADALDTTARPSGVDREPKIIVIDDEALIAETVVEILKCEGFDAVSVSSGDLAVELAKTIRPAVVLSDVMMPGLNGIETGIRIREIVPNCKIILFSGQAATGNLLEEARRSGHVFEILAKPIKPDHLVNVIRASLPSH
jgi:CheY-like chemotaxis protein